MERGPKSSWLCKIVKSVHTPADIVKLQRYLNKCSNEVPVIEEDTIEQLDRIIRNVFNPFESNAENHTYLMVILNCINFLSQKNCFARWISPNYERQPEFCTKFAVLMKIALKYIATYINVGDESFLTLLSVFKEIILKSSEHICLKNVFLRALSYLILKLIISGKAEFLLKKILLDLMVNLLEETDRQTRSDTFHKVKSLLCVMLKSLHKYGDYRTQMSAVEIIIRFTTLVPNERVDIAKSIQNEEIGQCFAKFSPKNFEMECRIILNLLNQTHGQNSNVFTIACKKAFMGNYSIKKPKHEDYKELWIDFNLDSQSITICCDGDSLMSVEENQMPGQSGYWEILTITSKNVRKLSMVPSGESFSGEDGITLMHLKLASPCDYIHATSTAAVSRCREICFYFKQSPEFKDLEDRILPQIFRDRHPERRGSATPDITLNFSEVLEQKTRRKSRQMAKSDQESNDASLRHNKNSESFRSNSYLEESNVIGASEKLRDDDPEKQLENLQTDLLKEIIQESEIIGSKHTQTTNSADASLKELYNKLAAHKFVKYSAVSPCAKKPDLSQINEALSNGKQSSTQTTTQKIFSNCVASPVLEETVSINEQSASEYVVNNTNCKENQRVDDKQKNLLQKETKFCHESSGGLVAATDGKQSINHTSTQKIFSNSLCIPVTQETVTVEEHSASEYVVNNITFNEKQRMDNKQKNLFQKESKFYLKTSEGLVTATNGRQTITQTSPQKIFSTSDPIPVLQETVTANEESVSEYVTNNTSCKENQKRDDKQKNLLLKENKFCLESSGDLVAVGSVLETNSEDCAGDVFFKSQVYEKQQFSQHDCGSLPLSSNPVIVDNLTDTVPVNGTVSENGLSAFFNKSSEQNEFVLDNVSLKNSDSKSSQILYETKIQSTDRISKENKLKCMSIQQKMLEINSTEEIVRDTGNTVSMNSTIPKKSNKQLGQQNKQVGHPLKKGKLKINCQKSITDKNVKNNSVENEVKSKSNSFLKNDVTKVTNTSEKKQEVNLISSCSEIQDNNINADQKSPENRECIGIINLPHMTQRQTETVRCKGVVVQPVLSENLQDVYEKPVEQPCKNLQTAIFKTPICDAAGPLASTECNNNDKRKTKNDYLQAKTISTDEKLSDKSEIITREISGGVAKESRGVSSSYTPKLSQHGIVGPKDKYANDVGQDIQNHDLSLSSSNSSPLFQPIKRDSHACLGTITGKKFFNTDKNSKSVETKVTYEKLCKKSSGKTESRISGRRRLFSSEAGIEIINVLFSSEQKCEQEPEKKFSRTVSAKKVNIATTKLVQCDVISKNGFSSKKSGKSKENFEISESDSIWHKIFPENNKAKSNSKNYNKKKISKNKNIASDNSDDQKFNRERKNKIVTELSDTDMSCRNIFSTNSKKRYNYNSTTKVKMSKQQSQTVNFNTKRQKLKEKKGSTVNPQNNSMHNKMVAELSSLPQHVLDTERMRDEYSEDEANPTSSKGVVKEASEMFFGKKEDKSSFEDFPSLVVEQEKKFGTEPFKYFDGTEIKDPFGEVSPTTNILNESSTSIKPTVVKNKNFNKELDNGFTNNSDVSLEYEDITSKRSVDILHSSDESETHLRNQPLLLRLRKENCNKRHCNTYKMRTSPDQAFKKNEIQSLIEANISSPVKSKLSLKQIHERESTSNNVRETKASSKMEIGATSSPSEGTVITRTGNYNPVQNFLRSSRPVKLNTICEVKKTDPGTNTINNDKRQEYHSQNADNRKYLLPSTGVKSRTTSTPYSIPGSLCFSSKTAISPIGSVKNSTSQKNLDKFYVDNSLNKPNGTVSYQLKYGLGTNNMNDSGCKKPNSERNEISEDIDKKSCKEVESYTKKETEKQSKYETNITTDDNEYSWEEIDSKKGSHRGKLLPPPKHLNKNCWFELPATSDQDQKDKRSCSGVKNTESETNISVGQKGKKYVNSLVCKSSKELMEMSNNDSVEECDMYSASLSSFSSRVNSEVSSGCHLNSDISLQSKRRRLNKLNVVQKEKNTETYSHKKKIVCRRRRGTVKYRQSIIALSQEQWKTASETANEDNENDSSCQPSEGNHVQNLLVSSLQKRMKIHKDYSETVVNTISNAAAELTTCCQDQWQRMVKEYEEQFKHYFEKVNNMLEESVSQQNEFHKFLKKYSSESQKRYTAVKEETQVLSACAKKMCEKLSEIVSYKEDSCKNKIQETEKLLHQEADLTIARERRRNCALVREKVCDAFNKRK